MTPSPEQHPDHLATEVLRRIENEHLVPSSRSAFLVKNYFFWALGALAVVLGALAFAATLFEVNNADWRFAVATHGDLLTYFLAAAPFLWVFALALFILIGFANVRQTAHGYRYSLAVIALGAILLSLTLGSGLYALGFGGAIEESIGDHPPFYRPILAQERSWWLAPERGLLGGQVLSVTPGVTAFVLIDFQGQEWSIDTSDLFAPDLAVVARGGVVRIVGTPASTTSQVFHACFVFPWVMHGGFRDDVPPPPLATLASTSARNVVAPKSAMCRNIRPFEQLRNLDEPDL